MTKKTTRLLKPHQMEAQREQQELIEAAGIAVASFLLLMIALFCLVYGPRLVGAVLCLVVVLFIVFGAAPLVARGAAPLELVVLEDEEEF